MSPNDWDAGSGPPPTTLFYCFDCGRRFFNKGWHAEACGSSKYGYITPQLFHKLAQADRQRDGITLSTVPQAPPKEHT